MFFSWTLSASGGTPSAARHAKTPPVTAAFSIRECAPRMRCDLVADWLLEEPSAAPFGCDTVEPHLGHPRFEAPGAIDGSLVPLLPHVARRVIDVDVDIRPEAMQASSVLKKRRKKMKKHKYKKWRKKMRFKLRALGK
eukprot:m.236802 g.236802  ORF g.236802 m.236802 type:complete len:138 (-) comp10901_c1_seq6:355-768(-)